MKSLWIITSLLLQPFSLLHAHQDHFLHIAPTTNNAETIDHNHLVVLNAEGLGVGRDFYDSNELTLQLHTDGPIWTFFRIYGSATDNHHFVGITEDGQVHCSLLRTSEELLTGVVQDISTGLWYKLKPDAKAQLTVGVVKDDEVPESADPKMIQEIPPELVDNEDSNAYWWNSLPSFWSAFAQQEPSTPNNNTTTINVDLVANILPRQQDCFSPLATVQVEGKGTVAMPELQIGDRVLTASGTYQPVYLMDHVHPTMPSPYLQIHTWARNKPLEVSPFHLLFVKGKSTPVPAVEVDVGDRLQLANGATTEVLQIYRQIRQGLYNPLTTDGTIVVDGIVASTYSAIGESSHLEIGGWKLLSCQTLVHNLLLPLRWAGQLGFLEQATSIHAEVHWYGRLGRLVLYGWDCLPTPLQATLFLLLAFVYVSLQMMLVFSCWCCIILLIYKIEQWSQVKCKRV